jgi:hypothetical protein
MRILWLLVSRFIVTILCVAWCVAVIHVEFSVT